MSYRRGPRFDRRETPYPIKDHPIQPTQGGSVTIVGHPASAVPSEWAQKPNSFPFDSKALGVAITSSPYFLLIFPKPNF